MRRIGYAVPADHRQRAIIVNVLKIIRTEQVELRWMRGRGYLSGYSVNSYYHDEREGSVLHRQHS